jgi:hypothetical protein
MAKPVDIQSYHDKSTMKDILKGANARTFVNVVQHLRDFGRFEMNKRDLESWPQREDRILVAEEEIHHEIQERHFPQSFSINVWVGIVENRPVGSSVLPRRLNGDFQFLNEILPKLPEEIPSAI